MQITDYYSDTASFVNVLVLTMFAGMVFLAVYALTENPNTIRKLKTAIRSSVYLLVTAMLFFTTTAIRPEPVTLSIIIIISIIVAVRSADIKKCYSVEYHAKKYTVVLLIISVYSSLACFGYRFFLYGDVRPHFSFFGLAYCVLGVIWFFPLLKGILCLIGSIFKVQKSNALLPKNSARAFLIIFAVLSISQGIVLFSFWPGVFPSDCTDQLCQAIGTKAINDWHPVIHTLFFRAVISVFHSAGMITAIQMLLFVTVCTLILTEGYKKGIKLLWLCVGGSIFLLLPNQVFSSILTEKDFLYSVALLFSTWIIFILFEDNSRNNKLKYVFFAADMFLIATIRHNGIIPFGLMVIMCIVIALKSRTKWKPLLITVITSILMFMFYKGPLFESLDVLPNTMKPYEVMLCAAGSCINKNLPLSQKSNEIMRKVMTEEEWGKYYGRFVGHDMYYWGGGSGMDLSQITAKEAFYVYFDALEHYPDVVIKDRLDGTNLLWDVTQPSDGFNYKVMDGIDGVISKFDDLFDYSKLSEEGNDNKIIYYNRSELAEKYRETYDTSPNSIIDILLWRSGAYVIMLFLLITFWCANKQQNMIYCSIPHIGNIVSLMLVMFHQSFRYVFSVQIGVICLLFLTLVSNNCWNTN